ncbi:MAG: hypothetical protein F6J96_16360 [Symploca sp. SIO1C2]|nr:hypothetical protein [Symploca sp. SIO1C2]
MILPVIVTSSLSLQSKERIILRDRLQKGGRRQSRYSTTMDENPSRPVSQSPRVYFQAKP